jgi:hypothetical protein
MFRLSAAPRIAPGATIGAAPAPMIGAQATNTAAAAMVTTNLRMLASQCYLIEFYNIGELPSGIDANQVMSGTRHLRDRHQYQFDRRGRSSNCGCAS